jgi:hypothetical protein
MLQLPVVQFSDRQACFKVRAWVDTGNYENSYIGD